MMDHQDMRIEHGYDGWADGAAHCACGQTFDSVQDLDRHILGWQEIL